LTSLAQFKEHARGNYSKLKKHVAMLGGAPGFGNAQPWNCDPTTGTIIPAGIFPPELQGGRRSLAPMFRKDCPKGAPGAQGSSVNFKLPQNLHAETNLWTDIYNAKQIVEDPGLDLYMVGANINSDSFPLNPEGESKFWFVDQLMANPEVKEAELVAKVIDAYSRDVDQWNKVPEDGGQYYDWWTGWDAIAAFAATDEGFEAFDWVSKPMKVTYTTPVHVDNCNEDGTLYEEEGGTVMHYANNTDPKGEKQVALANKWRNKWLEVVTNPCIKNQPPSVMEMYHAWTQGKCDV